MPRIKYRTGSQRFYTRQMFSKIKKNIINNLIHNTFDPNEPRDETGRWVDSGVVLPPKDWSGSHVKERYEALKGKGRVMGQWSVKLGGSKYKAGIDKVMRGSVEHVGKGMVEVDSDESNYKWKHRFSSINFQTVGEVQREEESRLSKQRDRINLIEAAKKTGLVGDTDTLVYHNMGEIKIIEVVKSTTPSLRWEASSKSEALYFRFEADNGISQQVRFARHIPFYAASAIGEQIDDMKKLPEAVERLKKDPRLKNIPPNEEELKKARLAATIEGDSIRVEGSKKAQEIVKEKHPEINTTSKKKSKNPLRVDPTRTVLLRRAFESDMSKRFDGFERKVVQNVMAGLTFNFNFTVDDKKLTGFKRWLNKLLGNGILRIAHEPGKVKSTKPWLAKYVESVYKKGLLRAYTDSQGATVKQKQPFYAGSKKAFLKSAFGRPERVSKIKMLYTRSYEDLKGITNTMATKISRTMANGMLHGSGPKEIAKEIRLSTGMAKNRAMVLARTELIAAHAEGQLDSFEDLGVDEIGADVEFSTSDDDAVCPECEALDGEIYTVDEARGVIPVHPQCRCSWVPAVRLSKKIRALVGKG